MDNVKKKKSTTSTTTKKKNGTTSRNVRKDSKTINSKDTKDNKTTKTFDIIENDNNKKNIKKKNKYDKTSIIMLVIFIILCITVCLLFGLVLHKNKELSKTPTANIVIPVIKKDNKMTVSLDLYSMKENEEYIFKVTNYRGDKVNDFDINYSIYVKNDSDCKIELYRIGNDKVNLMDNIVDGEIKGFKLYKNEKEDVYFKVVVSNLKSVKKKQLVSFMILS